MKRDVERETHPEMRPMRCTGPATTRLTRQAWKAGVPISAGTDTVAGSESLWPDVLDEIVYLARDVGMPPLEAINSATEVSARSMGQEAEMGTLVSGKLANFVVLTADPLEDIENIRIVELTVKRGREYRP